MIHFLIIVALCVSLEVESHFPAGVAVLTFPQKLERELAAHGPASAENIQSAEL